MPTTTKKKRRLSATRPAKKASVKSAEPKKLDTRLPGYVAQAKKVFAVWSQNRTLMLRLAVVFFIVLFITIGFTQQSAYAELIAAVQETSGSLAGSVPAVIIEIGVLFLSILSGSLAGAQSEGQQVYVGLIYLVGWLVTVWLLRQLLSQNTVTLRDGLYNAAAPVLSTLCVVAVAILQLLPLAIVAAIVSALSSSGVIAGWVLIISFILLFVATAFTIYWLASTLFAAVIVTIPGTYPLAALRSARQLVRGYRGALLRRIIWAGIAILLGYSLLVLPVIALDAVLGYPFAFIVVAWSLFVGVAAYLYGASYVYVLYREVIDGRAD